MTPLLSVFLLIGSLDPSILSSQLAQASQYDFTSTTTVREYILLYATTPRRALYIAENESGLVYNARGDLQTICKNKKSPYYGEPVTARGVFQITRCYHPEITDEQADDVVWATAWALPRIADDKTCLKEWTTCRDWLSQ